jgi:D-3-phosphoglycerate dehydrogenase
MSRRVLISPRSLTEKREPVLGLLEAAGFELIFANPGRAPSEEQLLELLPGCVGWIAGVEPISERVLRAATKLRVISRNGTGTESPSEPGDRRRSQPRVGRCSLPQIRYSVPR